MYGRVIFFIAALFALVTAEGALADAIHEQLEDESPTAGAKVLAAFEASPETIVVHAEDDLQRTYLHLAARYGHTDVVRWLVAQGAAINAPAYNQFTPLHLAAYFDRLETVQVLLALGADPYAVDVTQMTPMAAALSRNYVRIATFLRKEGVPVDLRSAVFLDDEAQVEALIKADPALVSSTPVLNWAAQEGRANIIRLLLAAGANIEQEDSMVRTRPLHWAVVRGHFEAVDVLIDAGARLDHQVFWKPLGDLTPLMAASWGDDAKIVQRLLDAGADPSVVNSDGKTAEDYAKMNNSSAALKLLQNH